MMLILIIMSNFVHIIPLGLEKDRNIYLLKEYPPSKVYFLTYTSKSKDEMDYIDLVEDIKDEMESLMPLAEKKLVTVSYEDFEEIFITVFEIMIKEKQAGNEVIMHVHSGPRMADFAAWLAASITNTKTYYLRAAHYLPKGEKVTSAGVLKVIDLLRVPVIIPTQLQAYFLEYLSDNKGVITGSLRSFVNKLGMEKFGKIKSINSAIVSMSHCIRELKREQFIVIKGVSRKRQRIEITDLGRLTARAYKILKENKVSLSSISVR